VRVLAAVDADAADVIACGKPGAADVRHRRFSRGGEGVQCGDRRRVVDDAVEGVGQADQPLQPAQRDLLELGCRRRRAPQHRLLVERRREKLAEDAGGAAGDGEVGEEAGMVPVRDAGKDDALEVGEDRVEVFAALRRVRGERVADRAGPYTRKDWIAGRILEVIRYPVRESVRLLAEVVPPGASTAPAAPT